MKKRLLALFLFISFISIGRSQIVYTVSSCAYSPIAGAGTALPLGDDIMSGMIPIGFTFSFYGNNFTTCDVSSNGFLTFNAGMGSGCCSGQLLPAAGWPTMIAWSWDDMYTIGGTVNYFTTGVAPNRIFVLNYNNVGYCCTSSNMATVQIQLRETTNEIRILSANNNHTGRTATMGVQMIGQGSTVVPGRNSTSWNAGANECQSFMPTIPPPPVNDNPCSATALTVGASCSYLSTTNLAATATAGVPAPGCATYNGADVWYSAVVPASGTITFDTQTGGMTNGGMAVYSGTCASMTLIECDDDDSPNGLMPMISLTGQTPGSTLWIRVWSFNNTNNGTFGICAYNPAAPSNDNPCSAISLPVNATCSYVGYTNQSATATAGVPAPGCAGYSGGDVWFSAVVPASGIINFDTQTGVMLNGGMAVYSGTCASMTLIACDDDNSPNGAMPAINLTGQTPGATLWIRVWANGNQNIGTFSICAFSPPPFCYTGGGITFAPDAAGGNSIALSDDQYSGAVNIGFNFCIDGSTYSQVLISSNGYLDFDLGSATFYSPWPISGPIPTSSPTEIMQSILGPWQDLYPPGGGTITYQTLGSAPNRRFVATWNNVPMFSCTGLLNTTQIKLFEGSNCIEIHITNKPLCTGWNGGLAVEGYNNYIGSLAWPVPGRNATQWSVTNDAVRLTPTCTPCSTAITCIVPLPVELTAFNAQCENGHVEVTWNTASELNNSYFSIERSDNGINYNEIGRVVGNGNSNIQRSYTYTDLMPIDGIGYYRLKQVDYDGEHKYYDPVSVHCTPAQLSLYPNPTTGDFKIIGGTPNASIVITDPYGNSVWQGTISGNTHFMSLRELSSGVYFVSISTPSGTEVLKLIIE